MYKILVQVREAFEKLGPINHLVYSVAFFGSKALEAEEKDWMTSLSVNVAGAGYMISAVVPRMKNAQKGRKSVCLMTSISQLSAQANRWTYGASKGYRPRINDLRVINILLERKVVNAVMLISYASISLKRDK